ncbi:Rieske (2Fe-2S) protein [Pseudomonas abieticivorans]|uniref:Rieske (2Fe-2S) protein n=1 Tax=Pseudomonas abieticivorans TaxID=2931382 RepID=UPI0020BF05FC|nr:Rieske 2Fe-2S domain-containing protein [Pseudomonas sp. PIA16]
MRPAIFLCAQASLAEGCARGFDPYGEGRDSLVLVRWQGRLNAWRNRCPHQHASLQYRKDRFMSADGQHLVCFAHGALFVPGTGVCVLGPCLGQSLQPKALSLDEHGGVWLAPALET